MGFPIAGQTHHRDNPGSHAGLTPQAASHVEIKTDGVRRGCAYIPDPRAANLVIAEAHRSPSPYERARRWYRPLVLQSKRPPVTRMIRTVECCRKCQRIIAAHCRKRGGRYLVPPPRQFQRSQPVKVAALLVAVGISVEGVNWRRDDHRHQSNTDHENGRLTV